MKPPPALPSLISEQITRPHHRITQIVLSFIFLALFAGIGTIVAQELTGPTTKPDSAAGLATFGERCANCHGPLGMGDGELAENLPSPPRNFTDPEFLRQAVPGDLFNTVTNGRIELGMPPFGPASSNPLPEETRWEAIAAVYALGTPLESIEQGQVVYDENCLACHGESGEGDGAEGADLDLPTLTDLTYWSNASNQAVFDTLSNPGSNSAHDYDLEDEDIWSVVDYIRTFSYVYSDPMVAFRPVAEATVGGIVTNGTTGEPAPPDTAVRLRAFTSDLDVTLTLTETVGENGRYQFDLTDIPQDWFFRVAIFYNDVEFGSDFDQVTAARPDLDLPVVIYEKTTDAADININQLHTILNFTTSDEVEVNQLYVVGNSGNSVYAGPTGDITQGTFELTLPDDAQLIEFQRGFGTLDSFFPTQELIPTANGWSDTLPVRPGQGTLILLVRYSMLYDDGLTLSHPLEYQTSETNLVLPDGIELASADGWQDTGLQSQENGTFSTYRKANLAANSVLSASLSGKPRLAASAGPVVRNETAELMVGGGILLIVLAIVVFAIRQWQGTDYSIEEQKADLLQDIADLDDEYEAGEVSESDYLDERESLMAELTAIWID